MTMTGTKIKVNVDWVEVRQGAKGPFTSIRSADKRWSVFDDGDQATAQSAKGKMIEAIEISNTVRDKVYYNLKEIKILGSEASKNQPAPASRAVKDQPVSTGAGADAVLDSIILMANKIKAAAETLKGVRVVESTLLPKSEDALVDENGMVDMTVHEDDIPF